MVQTNWMMERGMIDISIALVSLAIHRANIICLKLDCICYPDRDPIAWIEKV